MRIRVGIHVCDDVYERHVLTTPYCSSLYMRVHVWCICVCVSDSVSFERLMKYRGAQEERELSNNDSNRRNERKRLANLEGAIGGRSSQR